MPGNGGSSFGIVALIYSLQFGFSLRTVMYFLVQVEGIFTSVERILEFSENIDQEPPWDQPLDKELEIQNWPGDKCTLELVSVCMRYLPHLPRALEGVSVAFAPYEKVGIVGR